ncbi:uncharacterized protein BXZ73DRAFT_53996, partial [Epithele typhae]|uniref:uncharacterized protein n=1 Tax=Epithele typhae TaxID=378194 RepID=UPI002007568A
KIQEWLSLRQTFVDELLRFEGSEHLDHAKTASCRTCKGDTATLRCTQCDSRHLYCDSCMLSRHGDLLLHVLEVSLLCSSHTKFKKTDLRSLGVVAQLGHDGDPCPSPSTQTRHMVIVDTDGMHDVEVRFCECLDGGDNTFTFEWVQLFRKGWFPATTQRPATAMTFRMLDLFQELNFQAKTNLHDFERTLQRITDNSGCAPSLLSHCVRLWRHIVALKRAGRGHDPAGVESTQPGDLAVECPACPHTDKNLPEGWASADDNTRWLYTLFLMMDGNFRARLKDRGLDSIQLSLGWAYFVESNAYTTFINSIGDQTEKSSCTVEHKAILNANTRREGYITSGVGAILCARHALCRRSGMGDIFLGEKYAIFDYLLSSTVADSDTPQLLISYDLACQWHKHLFNRITALPKPLDSALDNVSMRFAIPKKHWHVHGAHHAQWSLNYLQRVARTYGEGIETHWGHMNPVHTSTSEMEPGGRHEVVDDHESSWNWQKIIGFASFFLKSLKEADNMSQTQQKNHEDFTSNLPPSSRDAVQQWEDELAAWQDDPSSAPDPYEEPRPTVTLKTVRLEIATQEAVELHDGVLPPHEMSPGVFLQVGLELEEQQRALQALKTKMSSAEASQATVQEKRNALQRRIELWQAAQAVHMPIAAQIRGSTPARTHTNPLQTPAASLPRYVSNALAEYTQLLLPSAIPASLRSQLSLSMLDKAWRLRLAQADDSLDDIRRYLRILAGIREFSRLNVNGTGQRTTGRVRSVYWTFRDKIARAASRYRAARAALLALDPHGNWRTRLQDLRQDDIRGPGRPDDDNQTGEGRYQTSWIWLVPRASGEATGSCQDIDPSEVLDNMKYEWARSKARADRWSEEAQLLEEEMRRVIEYFEWKSGWWRKQGGRRVTDDAVLAMGLSVYAEKQAAIFTGLATRCATKWLPYLTTRPGKTVPSWTERYSEVAPRGAARQASAAYTSLHPNIAEEVESDLSGDESDSV